MLTADLVLLRRRKGELTLPALTGKSGDSVRRWADEVLDAARGCVGSPRQLYSSLVNVMGETQQERKVARGLAKLVEDACDFDQANPEDSAAIRRELFLRATKARLEADSSMDWKRESVVQAVCAAQGWMKESIDERLYADLPGAQRMLRVPNWTCESLVELYDTSRIQAVLLRAVQVCVTYPHTTPSQLRDLFRQLKFRQLLHQSERAGDEGLCLTIDGPYSLFDSVTKYGLQLALVTRALREAGSFELQADVLWGARREPLVFRHTHRAEGASGSEDAASRQCEDNDELGQLMADLATLPSRFTAKPATTVIDLPGVGVCVPDITFVDSNIPGRRVHFELMGYWSRQSVWKRVELAEAGLPEPILFGVNQRLRVSEEVLDRKSSGALYVFRGRPNAKTLIERIEQLASR